MKFDLHCHSNASDGVLDPQEVMSLAIAADLSLFALTDHDTLAGYRQIEHCSRPANLRLINGVEFSCQWSGVAVHIVGLAMNTEHPHLAELLCHLQGVRAERGVIIAEKVAARIAGLDAEQLYAAALAHSHGADYKLARPHFAQALVEFGAVKNQQQAFKRLLGPGKVGDVRQNWPQMADVLAVIRAVGGIPILAHPAKYSFTRRKLRRLAEDFIAAGGLALEVLTAGQSPLETRELAELGQSLSLHASGGSDFHDPDTSWCKLGSVPSLPSICAPVWELL